MQAWASWAAFLVLIGGAYLYYTQNSRAAARGRSTTRTTTTSSAKESMQWAEPEKKSKAAPKSAKAKAPRKSVKTAVQEGGNKAEAALSAAVGAGSNAGDDRSSSTSSSNMNYAPSGRSVADMLDPRDVVPSVLSIKPSDKPARSSKPQAPKAEVAQETKKQRQNKRKAEEQKAAREAEEKERQVLLEKQRRTAREARGEPAKNGIPIAQAPESNPWTKIRPKGAAQAPKEVLGGQLLDTFEAAPTVSSVTAPSNSTAPTTGSTAVGSQYNNLLSEEEQVRFAMEDAAWQTVPKGGKKQKTKTVGGDMTDEGSDSGAAPKRLPVQPVQPVRPKVSENQKPLSRYSILDEPFMAKTDDPDDWPVV